MGWHELENLCGLAVKHQRDLKATHDIVHYLLQLIFGSLSHGNGHDRTSDKRGRNTLVGDIA